MFDPPSRPSLKILADQEELEMGTNIELSIPDEKLWKFVRNCLNYPFPQN